MSEPNAQSTQADTDIEHMLIDTERQNEDDTCLDDDEFVLEVDLFYTEVTHKKRLLLA
jgi:hypothetical protein